MKIEMDRKNSTDEVSIFFFLSLLTQNPFTHLNIKLIELMESTEITKKRKKFFYKLRLSELHYAATVKSFAILIWNKKTILNRPTQASVWENIRSFRFNGSNFSFGCIVISGWLLLPNEFWSQGFSSVRWSVSSL